MKRLLLILLTTLSLTTGEAQTRYNYGQLATERLDRGVIATRMEDGRVFVSWRTLRSDQSGEAFDVLRNGVKLNDKPLTEGGTWFIDEQPAEGDAIYEVRGGNVEGHFTLCDETPAGYFTIALNKPEGGKVPVMEQPQRPGGNNQQRPNNRRPRRQDTGEFSYSANDCSVGDVDGDGQLEIFVKWDPSNSHDNAHDGYTGPTLIDCYRLTGEWLWRIDLGHNIRSGAHYTQFMVYDFDGDGRAELIMKTADGTRDGQGQVLGDSTADWRNPRGRILDGPEYITVFEGLTGRALASASYIPDRGRTDDWGDDHGNRSERYLAAVGYLGADGGRASAIFCRGYYTRSVLAAWDWDGKTLTNRWTFDTDDPEWHDYAGQGNHNLRVADVDGDGLDEITYGSMAVDHDGRGLYNTRMGHGDAIHLVAAPKDNRLYIWDCHENKRDGSDLRDAHSGKIVFQIKSQSDVGRAMAADIDPTNPGMEMWSTDSHGVRDMKGEQTHPLPLPKGRGVDSSIPENADDKSIYAPPFREGPGMGLSLSVNFGIWWDGDLLRELLDRETVTKYDWEQLAIVDVQKFDGQFNNGTKSNPCLSADILGDWREEVVIRNRESTELRVYSTTIPTPYRINCLLQDIPYRLSVATENVGYNQPPEPGYYIGPDRKDYLK